MSRSRKSKHGKGPGYDFWSRRPHSLEGYGKDPKKACKRVERRKAKDSLRKGIDTPNKEGFGG